MRVVLCCIAKREQLYINEFVKWYLGIGVDKIYIYDNDNNDEKSIKDYISSDFHKKVEIIDIKSVYKAHLQQEAYNNFYKQYKDTFDWCIFCDVDEFLTGVNNIKALLKLPIYRNYNQIRIKWRLFGDDDLITRDMSKPIYKCIKKEVKHSRNRTLTGDGSLENQGKFILRGGLHNINITSPHFASYGARHNLVESCLPSGRQCISEIVIRDNYYYENIFFNHYMTKTLSEFIAQKLNRTDAVFVNERLELSYYWRINTKTKEKLDYLKEKGLIQ